MKRQQAILICDVVGSTALYERHGTDAAQAMIAGLLQRITDIVEAERGRVVKSLGDGLLCTFDDCERALRAVVSCQQLEGETLEFCFGVQVGEVLERKGDVFGDPVNVAARLCEVAKAGEALVSREVEAMLPEAIRERLREVPPIAVKGKRDLVEIRALRTDGTANDIAETVGVDAEVVPVAARLLLEIRGHEHVLVPGDAVTVGREDERDIVLDATSVSRLHARIFHKGDNFHLEDMSSNGTFLVPEGQRTVRVYRESVLLFGSGLMFFGVDPDRTPSTPMRYRHAR